MPTIESTRIGFVYNAPTEWANLQGLPSIDMSQTVKTDWQTYGKGVPMPPLYSVDIDGDVKRRLYIQYASNSIFAIVQHHLVAKAMDSIVSYSSYVSPLTQTEPKTMFSSNTMP